MGKVIDLLKKAESVELEYSAPERSDYNGMSRVGIMITPYFMNHQSLAEIMERKSIKMPFDVIITKDMGTATCPHCKAKYSGMQQVCTAMTPWHKMADGWYWQRNSQPPNTFDRTYKKYSVKDSPCGFILEWDLKAKFDEQVDFFRFVEFMGKVPDDAMSLIWKYAQYLPPGSADEYRQRVSEFQISKLESDMNSVFNALDQISQKMNAAGQNLTFYR